jgi:hypothetical protein
MKQLENSMFSETGICHCALGVAIIRTKAETTMNVNYDTAAPRMQPVFGGWTHEQP